MQTIHNRLKELQIDLTDEAIQLLTKEEVVLKVSPKVKAKLKYFKKKDLKEIHTNIATAKELILVIVNNFKDTLFRSKHSDNSRIQQGYKTLSSKILQKQVDFSNTNRYKKIIKLLIKEGIIERGNIFTVGERCTEYRLTDKYFNLRVSDYTIKTDYVKRLHKVTVRTNFNRVVSTFLGRNELENQSRFQLPTLEEVETHLRKKIKEGYTNKKGKRLYILGKKKRDSEKLYMEDYLDSFIYLRDNLVVPIYTEKRAGHRLITKYNLMPKVIRELITIDGESLAECDYSSLHPNITNTIYRGENRININHEEVAEYLGIERKEAKIEHLSFFNKKTEDMRRSPLYDYYKDNHFTMLFNVEADKERYGTHKITSEKLFSKETEMMEEVAMIAYNKGIEFFYVFDCMMTTKSSEKEMARIMNEVAKINKIKTTV